MWKLCFLLLPLHLLLFDRPWTKQFFFFFFFLMKFSWFSTLEFVVLLYWTRTEAQREVCILAKPQDSPTPVQGDNFKKANKFNLVSELFLSSFLWWDVQFTPFCCQICDIETCLWAMSLKPISHFTYATKQSSHGNAFESLWMQGCKLSSINSFLVAHFCQAGLIYLHLAH